MIFWRDVREAGGSFIMMIVFIILAFVMNTLSLLFPAAACLFVAVYMVIDRIKLRIRHPYSKQNASLIEAVANSIVHVDHQIWLLKNVLWWYLMPFALGISAFWLWILWQAREVLVVRFFITGCFVFLFITYYGVYRLNQQAVKKELQPRKEELETLLESISADSPD
jgi:hypothetical protein